MRNERVQAIIRQAMRERADKAVELNRAFNKYHKRANEIWRTRSERLEEIRRILTEDTIKGFKPKDHRRDSEIWCARPERIVGMYHVLAEDTIKGFKPKDHNANNFLNSTLSGFSNTP